RPCPPWRPARRPFRPSGSSPSARPAGRPRLSPSSRPPCLSSPLLGLGDRLAARLRHALALPVRERADADARAALHALVVEQHVRDVDRRLLLDDAALHALLARLGVTLDEVHLLDHHALLLLVHRQHLADAPGVVSGDHLHHVALADPNRHQMTSGASEMIFMNAFSRSSRATGPKMRVPRGSLSSLISTTAFSSNRMYQP